VVFFETYRRYYEISRSLFWASLFVIFFVYLAIDDQVSRYDIAFPVAIVAVYLFDRLSTARRLSSVIKRNDCFILRNIRNNIVATTSHLQVVEGDSHKLFQKYLIFGEDIGIFELIATPSERTELTDMSQVMSKSRFMSESPAHRMAATLLVFWYVASPLFALYVLQIGPDITALFLLPICIAAVLGIFTLIWTLRNRDMMVRTAITLLL